MRTLTLQDLHDIAAGSAVLGTGGGGDPYIGELAAVRSLEKYGPPQLIGVEDVADTDHVAIPFMIGSPVPLIEKFPLGSELTAAFDGLSRFLTDTGFEVVKSGVHIGPTVTLLTLTSYWLNLVLEGPNSFRRALATGILNRPLRSHQARRRTSAFRP